MKEQMHEQQTKHQNNHQMSYKKFILMIILSFFAMYVLMYAMVDRLENVIPNINQFYMAGLMTAAMVIIEMLLMGKMYRNRKINALIVLIGFVAVAAFWFGIREQTAVSDKEFVKSMIPHHAAAVLMVKQADLSDPEIRKLAGEIIEAQEKEIAFMKRKLKELDQ
ncbi:MAG: hypothetical protein K0S23_893 [Fluviicola sp.]|jgi:uncharacterized protein (DUF305 family)|uniref:DUF305 domain-containing protein n=1 Tax=Fluviicola sp. TaxID=1917219 RepID=UPI00263989B6|nr:DUF305 domain-containing protein [Fluviicola sp.]MDF3026586.1 hypothetical protein [Fluviicola sp.]